MSQPIRLFLGSPAPLGVFWKEMSMPGERGVSQKRIRALLQTWAALAIQDRADTLT